MIDESQPPVTGVDCDGDGFKDYEEILYRYPDAFGPAETGSQCFNNADDDGDGRRNDGCAPGLGTGYQSRCANTTASVDEVDDQWPADFTDDGVVNILDVASFATPAPAVWNGGAPTLPSDPAYNARWDLASTGLAINILDITAFNRSVPHLGGVSPGGSGLSLLCHAD